METSNATLAATAKSLVAPGKGILAADESGPTIEKRFKALGIPCTEESRRAYRDMLFTTPEAAQYISGVILFDETLRQKSIFGVLFPQLLQQSGIIPGIKVDEGTRPLALFPGETITEGLDRLRERLTEYVKLGARFAKWRATYTIGPGIPTAFGIKANAHALARYAALCQEVGLVPIVEPEVLSDGQHTMEECFDVTVRVQRAVFAALFAHQVRMEEMLLKPSMVTTGQESPAAKVSDVAEQTLKCLRQTVPPAVPGIVFLSGGQREEVATAHLNAMHQAGENPWQLTFSYGRALQASAMKTWNGQSANVAAAQAVFLHRAKMNSAASLGKYSAVLENNR